MAVPREEIEHFLKSTPLSNYQRIELPYGLEVPGKDHRDKIAAVLPDNLEGKHVLDVGCYYGLYSHEARKRGAARVVGVELDPERYTAAREIARFLDDGVEIRLGDIQTIDLDSRFDLVIFLSVLHHVRNPLAVMSRLASLCTGTVVVEFCTPVHRLRRKWHPRERLPGGLGGLRRRLASAYRTLLLNLIGEHAGIIVTGELFGERGEEYDWTFFFNKQSFRTLFQVHNRLFSEIEFLPSPQKRNRMLAFCHVADAVRG